MTTSIIIALIAIAALIAVAALRRKVQTLTSALAAAQAATTEAKTVAEAIRQRYAAFATRATAAYTGPMAHVEYTPCGHCGHKEQAYNVPPFAAKNGRVWDHSHGCRNCGTEVETLTTGGYA